VRFVWSQFHLDQLLPEPPTLVDAERLSLAARRVALGTRYPPMVFDAEAERYRPAWMILI